jgi:2-polyprenyl-3-methyl-5-hydroxy-6-metoxy-1,4-benzoquinol methylase
MTPDPPTQTAEATPPERATCSGENAAIFAMPPRDATFERRAASVLPLALRENPSAILDVGCSRGELLGRIPATIRRCGIDCLDPRAVSPGFEYLQRDLAQGIPFGEREFDVVLAGEVVEHLLDTIGFLRECRRVLRPGGVLLLTTPNLAYWRNLLQWSRQQQFFFVDHRAGENGHVRYFAPRTLRAAMVEAGFRVEALFSVGDLPTSASSLLRAVGKISMRCCPMRNLSLIAKARRVEA